MIDPYLILTVIGIVILVIGVVLLARKMKGGLILLLIGILWLFTMGLYYAFTYTGVYESGLYPIANIIGIVLLIIGLVLVIHYWTRAGILRR